MIASSLTRNLNLTFAVAILSGPIAMAQSPNPNEVYLRNISYAGSGCPAGSIAVDLSLDLRAFTVEFDTFIAEAGPGVPLSESRKNCQLNLDIATPQGWSYTVTGVETRGYASLDSGTSAVQSNKYYFSGNAASATLQSTLLGPMNRDYSLIDNLGLSSQLWSPCSVSRALNIAVQARASATGGRRALLTVDSISGVPSRRYFVRWRRC